MRETVKIQIVSSLSLSLQNAVKGTIYSFYVPE
jgi:hypothetical protein